MSFFKKKEKELAKNCSRDKLRREYERTEQKLERATNTGDIKAVKAAMKEHHTIEYAMLNQTYEAARRSKKSK